MRLLADSWADPDLKSRILGPNTNIMTILTEKPYNFKSPWPLIKVKLIQSNEITWLPMDASGWICPNDYFVIYLPDKPSNIKGVDQKDDVRALANYYQIFPTLLGIENPDAVCPKDGIPAKTPDLGIDPGPFLEFGGVTLRALALAWKNGSFFNELTNNNLNTDYDATPILSKYLGFTNPWNFKLQFKKSTKDNPNDEGKFFEWDLKMKCWKSGNLPQTIVKMHYPDMPEDQKDYWPIALTSYNNTGPAYPFTC
jgi:ribosomally synthesized peptide (two-chain TOMM family)